MSFIVVSDRSSVPKYKQIVNCIEDAILSKKLEIGNKLPSINSIRLRNDLSRDTVLLAYSELKTKGLIRSVVGKGYYLISDEINTSQKIFLLFDELNAFKEDLYDAFVKTLNEKIHVDVFFHHFNYKVFCKLIYDHLHDYQYYVIMPANVKGAPEVIQKLPLDKVFILDQTLPSLSDLPAVYQNFEIDVFNNLTQCGHLLNAYSKLILVFPSSKQPQGIRVGFLEYCKANAFKFEVIKELDHRIFKKGEVYIVLDDKDLIILVKKIKQAKLILGSDIGIISYNETSLKEIVENGITTISTDFELMGQQMAEMILNQENARIENESKVIIRGSL